MRFMIAFLFLPVLTLATCSQSTAGVSIPAGQTFVLGEYRTVGYRASLRNTGNQTVTAAVVDQQSGEAVNTIDLPAGRSESVSVGGDQEVHLINNNEQAAQVVVKSPVSGQQGMGFLDTNGDDAPAEDGSSDRIIIPRPAPLTSPEPAATANPKALVKVISVTKTLAPGEALIIGEGTTSGYTAKIRNSGTQIDVAGRNKSSGRQTQGFGLPDTGRETVNVRPTEDLYLINRSGRAAKVTVTLDREVSGARVAKM